jgi:hypothetical protein
MLASMFGEQGAHPFCEKKAFLLKKKSSSLFSAPMMANAERIGCVLQSNSLNKNDVLRGRH